MANIIQTTIELDLDKLRGQMKTAESEGKASGDKAGKGFGDGLEKGMSGAFGGLKTKLLGLGAALLGVFGAREIIRGAAEQEAAVNALNMALRNSGSFSASASKNLQDFASDLQKTSTVGDETAMKMLALAKSFGASNDQAKQLVTGAANLSAAMGIDLETATRQLGATLNGSAGRLGLVVAGMKDLTPEALKAGAALDLVNKRFAGAAADQTRTFSGALAQAKNAFGDIAEELGTFIVKSPAVIAGLNFMTEKFGQLADAIKAWGQSGGMEQVTRTGLEIARVFTMIIAPAVEYVINAFKTAGQAIGGLAAAVSLVASGEFRQAGEAIKAAFSDGFNSLTDFSGSAKANEFVTGFINSVNNAKPAMMESGRGLAGAFSEGVKGGISFSAFSAAFTDSSNKIQLTANSLAKQINQTIGVGVANSFVAFGQALASGANAAIAFGRAVLGVFADILIQIGTQMLAVGLGMSLVPVLFGVQGPAAVALGATMLIAGGALKALAGAGGSGAGSGASAGGGVAVGGTQVGDVSRELTTEVPDPQKPGTQVQVVVQGNVLDRRETGMFIAETIQEFFDSSGGIMAVRA